MQEQKFIMEKRTATGSLDFSGPQPKRLYWTEEEIAAFYYRNIIGVHNVTLEDMRPWFRRAYGWVWRVK